MPTDYKISGLAGNGTMSAGDLFEIVQNIGGMGLDNYKVTAQYLATALMTMGGAWNLGNGGTLSNNNVINGLTYDMTFTTKSFNYHNPIGNNNVEFSDNGMLFSIGDSLGAGGKVGFYDLDGGSVMSMESPSGSAIIRIGAGALPPLMGEGIISFYTPGTINGTFQSAIKTHFLAASSNAYIVLDGNTSGNGIIFNNRSGSANTHAWLTHDSSLGWTVSTMNDAGSTVSLYSMNRSGSVLWTPAAITGATASTEIIDWNFNAARIVQRATGAVATQRTFLFQAPTYSFVASSTITNGATVAISGPPIAGTNGFYVNTYALWVQSGNIRLTGSILWDSVAGLVGTITSQGFTIQTNLVARSVWSNVGAQTHTNTFIGGANTWITYTQTGGATGNNKGFLWTSAAFTNQTLSTELTDIFYNLAANIQFATGALTLQRAMRFSGRTYSFVGASTITDAFTLEITSATAGTNATITNNWALGVTGNLKVTGSRISFTSLPTSLAGLATGDLWSNSGVITIV